MPQLYPNAVKVNVLGFLKTLLLATVLCGFGFKSLADISPGNGEKIFKQYCSTCHALNNVLVGPALKDVDKRHSEEWILKWVHNNPALRATGDKEALAIYNQFQRNEMPTFTNLSDDDIKSILAYIKTGGTSGPQGPGGPVAVPETDYRPILWVVLAVFVLLTFLLSRINSNLRRLTEARLGEPVAPPFSWGHFLRQKTTIATLLLLFITYLGYSLTEWSQKLGRQRNYSPEQPIHFSHRLHAGVNQINCLYCHAGAEKSKHAMIPSPNICMNCHKGVQQGESDAGTAEIAKLTSYYNDRKPIQWIKVHNLPDHVYFNHSQHVKVGKIACQRCHGPVETMDQIYQFSSLSMGWCINCHRDTKVQFQSNDYYKQFEKLHEDLRSGKIQTVTEQMMGGTECQKCHY